MSVLFKKKNLEDMRNCRLPILFTKSELEQVSNSAEIRNLDKSEFVRRAALGRKADVKFDQKIVLTLHQLVQEIRKLYQVCENNNAGLPPDTREPLRQLIIDAGNAMQRISK